MSEERKTRQFWYADTEFGHAEEVTGYECADNPGYWWCPSVGVSAAEGFGLFPTRDEAVKRVRTAIQSKINTLATRLVLLDNEKGQPED